MDPALLKQREAFKKRAAQQPTVIKRAQAPGDEGEAKRPPPKKPKSMAAALKEATDLKATTASNSASFGVLVKIVDHMKKRHLDQSTWGLSLDEILEEIQIFDLGKKTKQWLLEALPNNRRIAEDEDGKFLYKPPYNVKGKNSLLKTLKKHDLEGNGGILMSELADCIANPDKHVQALGDVVAVVPTAVNKRKDRVVFYNDPESAVRIDEDFKALWRSVAVDHLDEKKVEEYLQKHGIKSMKDLAPKMNLMGPKRKPVRRGKAAIVHNDHLAQGILQDYSVD